MLTLYPGHRNVTFHTAVSPISVFLLRCLVGIAAALLAVPAVAAFAAPPPTVVATSHLHVSAERNIPPYTTDNIAFTGRSFGRMVPAQLRLRLFGPQSLYLQHSTRSRTFAFSWLGGTSSMPCKLQFANGSGGWTDITTTASSPLNCGTSFSGLFTFTDSDTAMTMPTQWHDSVLRVVRINDGALMGVFPQRLLCIPHAGSSSPTPNIDEDCNAAWDNTAQQYGCTNVQGCNSGNACYIVRDYNGSGCTDSFVYEAYNCYPAGQSSSCINDPDNLYSTRLLSTNINNCTYQSCSQVTYYY